MKGTRRTRIHTLVACAAVALFGMPIGATASGDNVTVGSSGQRAVPIDDWTHDEHDAQGHRYNPAETRIDPSNVASLRKVWTSRTNRFSTWVVSDGRIFHMDGVQVVATRVDDGSTIWSNGYEECWGPYRAVASPSLVIVYFDNGCSETGATDEALVTAFDARTGDIVWEFGPSQWVLWMGLVGDQLLLEIEGPFGIMSLDPDTGDMQWSIESDSLDGGWAAGKHRLYFAGSDYDADRDVVAAYRLADGALIWSRRMGPSYDVVIGGGRLFISGWKPATLDTLTRVVDKKSGAGLYRIPAASVAGYQPGILFTHGEPDFGAPSQALSARNPDDGTIIWSRPDGGTWNELVSANGVVYTSRIDGSSIYLSAYGAEDGRVLLQRKTGNDIVLAVTGGKLYLGRSTDDAVVALAPTTP